MTDSYPLFDAFPRVKDQLPRHRLVNAPSPVERLGALEKGDVVANLYIKRDDLCSPVFGGNKTRKLELILGKLVETEHRRLITFGFAGSNHAAATAIFSRRLGLGCVSMLMPQPPSDGVRRSLLAGLGADAEFHLHANRPRLILGAAVYRMKNRGPAGALPMVAAGGTTLEGNSAYVSAALELNRQIELGEIPRPSGIYLPAGSLGTAAGLILGLGATGGGGTVVPVRATDARFVTAEKLSREISRTARFLNRLDPTFPNTSISSGEIAIDHSHFGQRYGVPTPQGTRAGEELERACGIELDDTYSAKAFAAFMDAARSPENRGKNLLFWNTANSADMSQHTSGVDHRKLPAAFHRYFRQQD